MQNLKLEYFRNLEAGINQPLNSILQNQSHKRQRKIIRLVKSWKRQYKKHKATTDDDVGRLSDVAHRHIEIATQQNILLALSIERVVLLKLSKLTSLNLVEIENLTKIKKALTPILKPTKPININTDNSNTDNVDNDALDKLVKGLLVKL